MKSSLISSIDAQFDKELSQHKASVTAKIITTEMKHNRNQTETTTLKQYYYISEITGIQLPS